MRRGLWRDEQGSIAVHAAVLMTVVLVFVALGVDMSMLLLQHRRLQAAADEAGMAASDPSYALAERRANAVAVAATYGYRDGINGATVSLLTPPSAGSGYSTDATATEVILTTTVKPSFARIIRPGDITLKARTVAKPVGLSIGCLLALDTSSTQSVLLRNSAVINNVDCELDVNSTSTTALVLQNNAIIYGSLNLVGNYSKSASAQLLGPVVTTNGMATADPYASVVLPAAPACTTQSGTMSGVGPYTRNAGNFCSGISIGNNAQVTLNPGVYYVGSSFTIGQNAVVKATGGVTIILTSATSITFSNNASFSVTAPSSGATAGLALLSTSSTATAISVSNGATLNVTGALYFPNSTFTISGNAITNGSNCTQLIAKKIDMGTTLQFKANCDGVGVRPIGRSGPRVVS